MNHHWECISVGEYDSLYECKLCKKRHTESVDKIGSERPATGCQPDDSNGHISVVKLYESNHRDPVSTLRGLATAIERGEHGRVSCCAIAVMGDTLEIFGMGPDAEISTMHLLFCTAAQKIQADFGGEK